MKVRLFLTAFICVVCTLQVWADKNLYGPEIPENTALVRVINAVTGGDPFTVHIGALSFADVQFAEVTPYRPIVPDIHIAVAGETRGELILKPGSYYSVVVTEEAIAAWKDTAHTDPARAQLYLYNFSAIAKISLETWEEMLPVINGVKNMSSDMVVVNPVPVRFRVVWHDQPKREEVPSFTLERGESFSVVVFGPQSEPNITVWRAQVEMN